MFQENKGFTIATIMPCHAHGRQWVEYQTTTDIGSGGGGGGGGGGSVHCRQWIMTTDRKAGRGRGPLE